ncbi:hypothetical protein [Trueperella bialowiezensis]|uniref:FAR-17a/AIG1-like protein n=1 Tax=Trueperella bialowiezensis TaxID=312285 RepID=A0A3S4VSD8_9ACTO|nr:hypothetical protein [Trueperella bialowiezensis]VEI12709.1 Uncharacterised protein [Trueperella bialowiezensis]
MAPNAQQAGRNLWALFIWAYRVAIAGFSGWYTYYSLSVFHDWNFVSNFAFLTQCTALLVFVYYAAWAIRALLNGVRKVADFPAEIRGFIVLLAAMVGIIFNALLGPAEIWPSKVSHIIIPVLVVGDWLVCRTNQHRLRPWVPLTWLVPIVVYLGYYIWFSTSGGYAPPYPFLDPSASDFLRWVAILALAFLAGGYVVYGVGKIGARAGRARTR